MQRKFDKVKTKAVIGLLDAAVRKYGLLDVRHAVNNWSTGQRDKIRLHKQSVALQRQLADVNRRLGK